MASLKAWAVMGVWSLIGAWIMTTVGFVENHRDPMWALGAAIVLMVILVVNFLIYFRVAKEEPWKWFKE